MSGVSDTLLRSLTQSANVRFSFVAGLPLLLYDTLIVFGDEVDFIWLQRWSLGKWAYILTRYWAFFDVIVLLWYYFGIGLSPDTCKTLYSTVSWSMTFGICMSSVVLIIRTYAIWGRNIHVVIFLASFRIYQSFLSLTARFTVLIIKATIIGGGFLQKQTLDSFTYIPSPYPTIYNRSFITNILGMAFELRVVLVSLYKGFQHWVHVQHCGPIRESGNLIIIIFGRLTEAISLANGTVSLTIHNSPYKSVLQMPLRVFHSIFASRLIINVRKASVRPGDSYDYGSEWDNSGSELSRSIQFANEVYLSRHAGRSVEY
ncbi:hypothetical protein SCHPADRAFT_887783 [Schizopora paradoxa]|uniref:DUF6533 domain-containing protein n=1 Tax=Schizopora paradoxa TaxID=27342 RepID=A0A0H2RWQ6_9AGAM|nr:hypothetical protein SCHPADRAFT_887783 [Schizopora paradoxa]